MQIPWYRWGGGAAAAAVADYADVRMRPVSQQLTNSEIVALLALLADATGFQESGPRAPTYGDLVRGAADWGAGMLAAGIVRRHLTASAAPPVPTVVKTVANPYSGPAGIPAASMSAAYDLPTGGF